MAAASTSRLHRRAADLTALRLGRALLGYLALMTGIITLAPFEFQASPAHGLTTVWNWSDLLMNILLFVPIGFVFQLTRPRGALVAWWQVLLVGAAVSGSIEVAQLFSPQRYTSLVDLASNTFGALTGAALFARVTRHLPDDTVRSLALELPLMGLVYQLVPLAWLVGLGAYPAERRWLVLFPVLMAGTIVGAVHAAYVMPRRGAAGRARRWRWSVLTGWAVVALPLAVGTDLPVLSAAAVMLMASAEWSAQDTRRRLSLESSGRFELPTLRRVMPVFAAYLATTTVVPMDAGASGWQATWLLALPWVELSQPLVFRVLEQVAAFTLVGYISAEYHGRRVSTTGGVWVGVLWWSVPAAVLLQGARGWLTDAGASASLLVLTQVAALFGAWLYVLQRAHVQALVARRAPLPRESSGFRDRS